MSKLFLDASIRIFVILKKSASVSVDGHLQTNSFSVSKSTIKKLKGDAKVHVFGLVRVRIKYSKK